jgi:uncharacterized membrane protein
MLLGELVITGRWGWAPLAVSLAAMILVLVWSYGWTNLGRFRWVCAVCKALGVGILVFCLLEPVWSGRRVRPGANLLAVVADNSEGLSVRDRGASQTRGEQLRDVLSPVQGSWLERLEQNFDLRRYQFDRRLRTVRDFEGLDFSGRSTSLYAAVAGVAERLSGLPLAGIIVLTDGNATDRSELLEDHAGLPPVYPVVMGQGGAVRDLALVGAQVTQSAFEDAPVTIRVDVQAVGFRGREVVGRLIDRSDDVLKSVRARIKGDMETVPVEFDFKGQATGTGFYRVEVDLVKDVSAPSRDDNAEATLANNTRAFVVDHGRGSHRILYVAGRPNWEFKYLNRALQQDDQLQLVGLIRVAMREPKFDFRGRGGESSNPLYRGFGDQDRENVERYDQPVLVRLNTRDGQELSAGFPMTPEELFGYEAIICDDVEAEFFSTDQANLVRRFVSERGGGLLMLGGAESFREGGYHRTPIGDTLPVYLHQQTQTATLGELQWDLSREGWLQPWARLRNNESAERVRLEEMTQFHVLNQVGGVKPGASTIATVLDQEGRKLPALVTQRFGRGRTACFLVGDFWRWGMRDAESREDLNQTWRQIARWLVADVPRRAELVAVPSPASSLALELQTRVRTAGFEPMDDAIVSLEVQEFSWNSDADDAALGSSPVRLRAELSLEEAGRYDVTFVPRDRGAYEVTAAVTNAAGAMIHRLESGWATDAAGDEFRSLEPDFAAMFTLAQQTGGEVVAIDKLRSFARGLPSRSAPVMEAWSAPAWHTPWLFALALALFAVEWGVRRWKGLP